MFEVTIKSEVYEIAKKLGSRKGFFDYYFSILKNCETCRQAFELVNEMAWLIFGEYRYSSYTSFTVQKKRFLKNGGK